MMFLVLIQDNESIDEMAGISNHEFSL